jgi:hypothetical protein
MYHHLAHCTLQAKGTGMMLIKALLSVDGIRYDMSVFKGKNRASHIHSYDHFKIICESILGLSVQLNLPANSYGIYSRFFCDMS